jgi:hypothetical protein
MQQANIRDFLSDVNVSKKAGPCSGKRLGGDHHGVSTAAGKEGGPW